MILTKEILQARGACPEGIGQFNEDFPGGLSRWDLETQLAAIVLPSRRYLGWCWSKGLLPRIEMRGADLQGVDLRRADLEGADFRACQTFGPVYG
jgi:uncharacterized protein YjbI with pentapeptide repeats